MDLYCPADHQCPRLYRFHGICRGEGGRMCGLSTNGTRPLTSWNDDVWTAWMNIESPHGKSAARRSPSQPGRMYCRLSPVLECINKRENVLTAMDLYCDTVICVYTSRRASWGLSSPSTFRGGHDIYQERNNASMGERELLLLKDRRRPVSGISLVHRHSSIPLPMMQPCETG